MPTEILRTAAAIAAVTDMPAAGRTPFDAPALARRYFEAPPPGVRPFVIAVRDGENRLTALAPWCLSRDRLGLTRLTGLGGEDAWFHDPWLASPAAAGPAAAAIAAVLEDARGAWDYMDLLLSPEALAPLTRALGRLHTLPPTWRRHHVMPLAASIEETLAGWSKKTRKNARHAMRRFEAVPHRFIDAQGEEAIALMAWIFAAQRRRWPERRDWGPYHAFMAQVCRASLAGDHFSAHALEIEGTLAAGHLLSRHETRAFGLMIAYDEAFAAHQPGTLLKLWSIQRMITLGATTLDPGPGDEFHKTRVEEDAVPTAQALMGGTVLGRAWVYGRAVAWPAMKENAALRRLKDAVMRPGRAPEPA